jgi:uncharacterized protein YdhG (YjbR/CyaY superfamily)
VAGVAGEAASQQASKLASQPAGRARIPAMAMKKAKSGADGVAAVEAYLARTPEPQRTTLENMRAMIRAAAPKDAEECISYGMPAFRYKGALVGYAAFKKHCSFFPMGAAVLDELSEEVAPYRTAKGTLQFAVDKPLPAALVKKLVKARVRQNEGKTKRR